MTARSGAAEQMTFQDVAEWAASLPDDDRVYVDRRFGHICIGDVVFADLGGTLDMWSYSGHHLTPTSAAELGRALLAWALSKAAHAAPGGAS